MDKQIRFLEEPPKLQPMIQQSNQLFFKNSKVSFKKDDLSWVSEKDKKTVEIIMNFYNNYNENNLINSKCWEDILNKIHDAMYLSNIAYKNKKLEYVNKDLTDNTDLLILCYGILNQNYKKIIKYQSGGEININDLTNKHISAMYKDIIGNNGANHDIIDIKMLIKNIIQKYNSNKIDYYNHIEMIIQCLSIYFDKSNIINLNKYDNTINKFKPQALSKPYTPSYNITQNKIQVIEPKKTIICTIYGIYTKKI
jgi:hypothetical protein